MTQIAQSLDKLHRGKLADIKKASMFSAYPQDIHEIEGFNPRDYDTPEMRDHIQGLADAYAAGRFVPPVVVQVIDGVIYARDGHCRRRGMLLAIEQGAELGKQPLVEFRGSEEDAEALVLTSQEGKKLEPLEVALMYNRMSNRGLSSADIASNLGKSSTHVTMMLEIHAMPDNIKALVHSKMVSATLAIETFREHGSKAVQVLKAGLEDAESKGKNKVTKKHLKSRSGDKPVRIGKKVVSRMVNQVQTFGAKLDTVQIRDDGSAILELSAEEVALFSELRQLLPEEKNEKSIEK